MKPTIHVLQLPAAEIRPNPRQPRRVFDEAGLRELAASIRAHGVLQPLTVRRTAEGWELIAGERRLRASRLAGLETVPCILSVADINIFHIKRFILCCEIFCGRIVVY